MLENGAHATDARWSHSQRTYPLPASQYAYAAGALTIAWHLGYGLGRRRFQLYHNPVAPTAAAARSSQSIGVIALCPPADESHRSDGSHKYNDEHGTLVTQL